jgi:hypothetical protein
MILRVQEALVNSCNGPQDGGSSLSHHSYVSRGPPHVQSVVRTATGPQPLPMRVLQTERSSASTFKLHSDFFVKIELKGHSSY